MIVLFSISSPRDVEVGLRSNEPFEDLKEKIY